MSTRFEQPGDLAISDSNGRVLPAWSQWFTRVHTAVSSLYQSGSTANRPTTGLWIGRQFYDTTLNKPVWVSAVKPAVWRDASGAIV